MPTVTTAGRAGVVLLAIVFIACGIYACAVSYWFPMPVRYFSALSGVCLLALGFLTGSRLVR